LVLFAEHGPLALALLLRLHFFREAAFFDVAETSRVLFRNFYSSSLLNLLFFFRRRRLGAATSCSSVEAFAAFPPRLYVDFASFIACPYV
tara:strand:- start:1 stop:270 length:270 start_codon:yes stop_codon:yes gene_type:complete